MKFKTIDGEEFDCELEALRHENDILTERLNNCREMCINDRLKEKHNRQYGCYGAAQRTVQAGNTVHAIMEQLINRYGVENITMNTDSFFMIIPDGEIVDDEPTKTPVDFSSLPTWAMVDELAKRTGVQEIDVGPESSMELVDIESGGAKTINGPARVLVVVD